jgi:hypothetical protein
MMGTMPARHTGGSPDTAHRGFVVVIVPEGSLLANACLSGALFMNKRK